jgi:SAM-dependent MidA family methyltransferase
VSGFKPIVLDEVRRRGRVTFAEYMTWALYHPKHGYYTAGPARWGREGDFFTSVQAGGLFGALLAETFGEMWDLLGCGRFHLVELGGGDGALAEQVLRAMDAKGRSGAVSYSLVERSPAAREAARRRLSRYPKVRLYDSIDSFEHVSGVEGCVFSNEFFDALPFHRVQRVDGVLRELYVAAEGDALVEAPGDPSTPRLAAYLREQGVELDEGQKAEVRLEVDDAVAGIGRVLARGFALTVDYGEPTADLYRPERRDGTLRTFRRHAVDADPFADPGGCDITASVDFGRLARVGEEHDLRPVAFASQGAFLVNSGEKFLKAWVEEEVGKKKNASAAAALQQLVHPDAMGSRFQVLVQARNAAEGDLSGAKVNRIHRLKAPVVR